MDSKVILDALIELVKTGGPMALWGIGIWLTIGFLKVLVVSAVVYLVGRLIHNTIITCYRINKECTANRIHLLSQEVSNKLTDSLDNFVNEAMVVVKELKEQLRQLKEKLDGK